MGSRLPSEQEVLIIRPTGIMGSRNVSNRETHGFRGPLPGSQAFQSRIRTRSGPVGMQ